MIAFLNGVLGWRYFNWIAVRVRQTFSADGGFAIKQNWNGPFNFRGGAFCFQLALLTAIGGSVHAQEIGSAEEGYQIAIQICAECHSVEKGNHFSINKNATPFEAVANTPGMSELALHVWFKTPHPTMPNFKFNEQDTADIVQYILSLRNE